MLRKTGKEKGSQTYDWTPLNQAAFKRIIKCRFFLELPII